MPQGNTSGGLTSTMSSQTTCVYNHLWGECENDVWGVIMNQEQAHLHGKYSILKFPKGGRVQCCKNAGP